MLFNGERIGDGRPPATDIAVDPIEGTVREVRARHSSAKMGDFPAHDERRP